jgi:AcrR family transcriptional regulator
MGSNAPTQSRSEDTRLLLLKAATTSFAYDGFHATSLKQIARAAGVNQALIAYYFGNKQGLYLAVFEAIVGQIQADSDREALRGALFSIVDAMLDLLSGDESREWALLITREQASPTEAFEVIYNGFMGEMLGLASQVILRLKPGIAEQEARLLAVLIMGQVLVFRVSRTAVLRHMVWSEYGEDELASSRMQLHRSISAWLAQSWGVS